MTDSLQLVAISTSKYAAIAQGFTLENVLLFILGSVFYFTMEYKLKRGDKSFSMGFWIKDNWYNVVGTISLTVAYFILKKNVSPEAALGMGLAPNLIADWAGTIIARLKQNNLGG